MKSLIIGTYFGSWPVWLPAFLVSCERNENIDWLFVTDCEEPPDSYLNIRFMPWSLAELNQRASEKLNLKIQKDAYAQLDLRPAYGLIFEEEIRGYDFWGHCDFDVVWGDIYQFFEPQMLQQVDLASSRRHATAGHLTLWRNSAANNSLFSRVDRFDEILEDQCHRNFDERIMSRFLRSRIADSEPIRTHWPEMKVVGWPTLEKRPRGWRWVGGKLFDGHGKEHMYMHFLTWKDSLKQIDFGFGERPDSFLVTRRGIWSSRRSMGEVILDSVPIDRWLEHGFRNREVVR